MSAQLREPQLQRESDDELLGRIRNRTAGWQSALSLLLHRYRGELLGYCHARLGNRHDAEDAIQETIIRAYRGLPGFKGDASFRTWIHSIAENQCRTLSVRRARHVMADHLRELVQLHETMRNQSSGITKQAEQRVHQVLEDIAPPYRDVLFLRFYRDLSLDEIARTLGISLSAAKMRLYRALDQFAAGYELATQSRSV